VTFLLLIRNVVHANISTTMNIQFGTLTFATCSVMGRWRRGEPHPLRAHNTFTIISINLALTQINLNWRIRRHRAYVMWNRQLPKLQLRFICQTKTNQANTNNKMYTLALQNVIIWFYYATQMELSKSFYFSISPICFVYFPVFFRFVFYIFVIFPLRLCCANCQTTAIYQQSRQLHY